MNHFAPNLWHLLITVCSSHRYHPKDAFDILPSFLPGLGLAEQKKAFSKTFVIQIHPFKYDTERLHALLNNIKLWHKKLTESKWIQINVFNALWEKMEKKILLWHFATFFHLCLISPELEYKLVIYESWLGAFLKYPLSVAVFHFKWIGRITLFHVPLSKTRPRVNCAVVCNPQATTV